MVYVLYLLSGIAALLYQVVWTKELSHQFGVTSYAVGTFSNRDVGPTKHSILKRRNAPATQR